MHWIFNIQKSISVWFHWSIILYLYINIHYMNLYCVCGNLQYYHIFFATKNFWVTSKNIVFFSCVCVAKRRIECNVCFDRSIDWKEWVFDMFCYVYECGRSRLYIVLYVRHSIVIFYSFVFFRFRKLRMHGGVGD